MSTSTPPWGHTGWKPSGDDGKFKPGQSGCPTGRPPGIPNKKTLVAKALDDHAEDVVKAMIAKAKEGDTAAGRLILERVHAPKRQEGNRVNFKLDADAPVGQQARQVINAMATGEVDVEIGQIFLNSLSTFAGLLESDELVKRIGDLEEAARAGAQTGALLGKVMETNT